MPRSRTTTPFALALALAVGAACGHGHGSIDEEACHHLEEGPEVAVTAAAEATDGAAAIADDHKRYDVSLIDVGGGKGGFLRLASGKADDYVFFLDQAVPVAFRDSDGAAVAPSASAGSSAECALVRGRHVVPLGVGTYFLELGPTAVETVSIVVERDHAH